MLCTTCAGTSYSAFPNEIIPSWLIEKHNQPSSPGFEGKQWVRCPDCLGIGGRIASDGSCSYCEQTIIHWQRCTGCRGTGRVYLLKNLVEQNHHQVAL